MLKHKLMPTDDKNDITLSDLDIEQSQLPNGLDLSDDKQVKPFRREREDYLFKYEGLFNILITTALLVGAHLNIVSIWWLFGFFAITIIPQEFNKIREYGLEEYLGVLNFNRLSLRDFGTIVVGLVGIFTLLITATYITFHTISGGGSAVEQGGHLISDASFNVWIWLGAVLVMYLIVGPLEEYMFRDKLQGFLKNQTTTLGAILGTNAVFSVLHLPVLIAGGSLLAYVVPLILLCILGCVFSVQYEYTENLAVPSLTHSTYNSIVLTVLFVTQSGIL